jgi:hypothetical protein
LPEPGVPYEWEILNVLEYSYLLILNSSFRYVYFKITDPLWLAGSLLHPMGDELYVIDRKLEKCAGIA